MWRPSRYWLFVNSGYSSFLGALVMTFWITYKAVFCSEFQFEWNGVIEPIRTNVRTTLGFGKPVSVQSMQLLFNDIFCQQNQLACPALNTVWGFFEYFHDLNSWNLSSGACHFPGFGRRVGQKTKRLCQNAGGVDVVSAELAVLGTDLYDTRNSKVQPTLERKNGGEEKPGVCEKFSWGLSYVWLFFPIPEDSIYISPWGLLSPSSMHEYHSICIFWVRMLFAVVLNSFLFATSAVNGSYYKLWGQMWY